MTIPMAIDGGGEAVPFDGSVRSYVAVFLLGLGLGLLCVMVIWRILIRREARTYAEREANLTALRDEAARLLKETEERATQNALAAFRKDRAVMEASYLMGGIAVGSGATAVRTAFRARVKALAQNGEVAPDALQRLLAAKKTLLEAEALLQRGSDA